MLPVRSTPQSRSVKQWLNPAALALPAAGTFGSLGIGTICGLGAITWTIIKHFRFAERRKCSSGLFFSLPNHPIFGQPNTVLTNSTFGRITPGSGNRQVQLSLRYEF